MRQTEDSCKSIHAKSATAFASRLNAARGAPYYTDEELAKWVARISDSGAVRVRAYFNDDWEGHAIKNARALHRLLSRDSS